MKKRLTAVVATTMLMVVSLTGPAFAADSALKSNASPGHSDFTGSGATTAKFAPAATPGNS